jgi:hypothetical protein
MGSSRSVLSAVLLVLLFTVPLTGCVEDYEPREYVRYRVLATSSTPAEILVPQPICGPVLERLKVVEGKGEFATVETIHGPCLKLTFGGRVVVQGRWYPDKDPELKHLMTINLTTMDPNETEPYSWNNKEPDIPNVNAWVNWSKGPDVEFYFKSSMLLRHEIFMFSYYSQYDALQPGWNEVVVEGMRGEENAP